MTEQEHERLERLEQAYRRMAERVRERLEAAEEKTAESLKLALIKAQDEAIALKELSRQEAEQVAAWLRRDLRHLAQALRETGEEIRTWLPVEVEAEEAYLLDKILSAADPTTLAWLELKEQAALADYDIWRTGEVTGPGVLECTECGERLHFTRPSRIPPCPKCHNTTFVRLTSRDATEPPAGEGGGDDG